MDAKALVVAGLRAGLSVAEAARRAGVTRQAVYLWAKADKDVKEALEAKKAAPHPAPPPVAATGPAGASQAPPPAPPPPPPAPAPDAALGPGEVLTPDEWAKLHRMGLAVMAEKVRAGDAAAAWRLASHAARHGLEPARPAPVYLEGLAGAPPPEDGAEWVATKAELASLLGTTTSSVISWQRKGMPKAPGGGYVLDDVRRWLLERGLKPGRTGAPPRAAKVLGRLAAETGEADAAKVQARLLDGLAEVVPGAAGETADSLLLKESIAKARKTYSQAQLEELKLQRERGLLVDRSEVMAWHAEEAARARARLMSLPGALCQLLAEETDPARVRAILEERIRAALEDVARVDE